MIYCYIIWDSVCIWFLFGFGFSDLVILFVGFGFCLSPSPILALQDSLGLDLFGTHQELLNELAPPSPTPEQRKEEPGVLDAEAGKLKSSSTTPKYQRKSQTCIVPKLSSTEQTDSGTRELRQKCIDSFWHFFVLVT